MQESDARLDHLDLRDLRLLAALIETRSVTRTAERFGLSQPAASRALDRLRRALGDRIVVRSGTGGVLTPRGQAIARQIGPLFGEVLRLFEPDAFDPRRARSIIRLAATDYGATVVAGPLAAHLLSAAPGLQLVVGGFTAETFEQLAQGAADLALYADADIPPDFHAEDLFHETYSCLVRDGHPALAAERDAEHLIERLADAPRAISLFPDGRRLLPDDVLGDVLGGPAAQISFATPYFFSGAAAVAKSDMIMCLPTRAATVMARAYGLRAVPLPADAGFTYRVIWHDRCHQDRQHAWMRAALREVCTPFRSEVESRSHYEV